MSSNHILIVSSNRSQPLACHVQADGSIGAGFIDAMLTESGGRSSAAATWEGALRSAFVSVAALPLTELPASFGAKLRVLDVMLQAPAMQQCLVRTTSFTSGSRLGPDIQQCQHAMHRHVGIVSLFAPVLLVVRWSRLSSHICLTFRSQACCRWLDCAGGIDNHMPEFKRNMPVQGLHQEPIGHTN